MNETHQILRLYETGASPDIIAQAMSMSREHVHAILFENSSEYKRQLLRPAGASPLPLSDEMMEIIVDVARNTQNDFARMSAAKYVRNDLKGRLDAIPQDAGVNSDVMRFLNEQITKINANRRKFIDVEVQPAISV